jgi:hypothetical protein
MALFKYGFSSSKANQDAPDKKRKGRDETKKSYEKEKRMRSFYSKWTDEFPWVEFDETENVMYCIACKKYDKVGRFVEGTSNFRIDTLKQHDASRAHVDAYKRYKVDKMKENSSSTVFCSYTGDVETNAVCTHDSQGSSSEGAQACLPSVVGPLDISLRKLNQEQRTQIVIFQLY